MSDDLIERARDYVTQLLGKYSRYHHHKERMEESQHYKGYVLIASPVEIDKYHWGIRVIIERHEGEEVLRVEHEAQGTELTEVKAVEPSLKFGRRIVDGNPMLRLP